VFDDDSDSRKPCPLFWVAVFSVSVLPADVTKMIPR
jgi:hypothetical protein